MAISTPLTPGPDFEIMDDEIIRKFDVREGSAEDFYDVDKE